MATSQKSVRLIAVTALAGALAVAWVTASDFAAHVGEPDPGFVMFENGVVGPPWLSADGAAFAVPELRMMDRVVAVDGHPVDGGRAVQRIVTQAGAGSSLRYRMERPDGRTYEVVIPTRTFSERNLRELLLFFLLGGLLLLAVGAVPILVRPELVTSRIFFLWTISWATNFCLLTFDYFFTYNFMPWNYVASWLAKASLIHVGLIFPLRRWPLTRWPRRSLILGYGVLAILSILWVLAMHRAPWAMYQLDKLAMPTFTLGLVLLAGNVALTAFRCDDVVQRQRARVVLAGPVLILAAWCPLLLTAWLWHDLGIPLAGYIGLACALPISVAYGILKHNIFEFNVVGRRAVTAGSIAIAVVLAYLALFAGLARIAGVATAWAAAALSAAILAILIPGVAPLRRRIEGVIEDLLFPEHRRAQEAIRQASLDLARLRQPADLVDLLRQAIEASVQARTVRLVAGPPPAPLHEIAAQDDPVTIDLDDPLRGVIARGRTLNLDVTSRVRSRLAAALRRRLEALDVHMVVTLPATEETVGLIMLGPRRDGRLYTSDDESCVETLAGQSSVAIESARAWEEVQSLQRQLAAENVHLRREVAERVLFDEIVGESGAIRGVLSKIEQVAPTDATVLITGETGTGKELVVRAIHRLSSRSERALVKISCAAIPDSLLESELFGYEKGAFTGAGALRQGRFEQAHGGTLLLDDVDTLPPGIQAKLLRALQEGEVQRLGGAEPLQVDVRVVATTNRDLHAEVRAGRFREDLYYRLNVVPIHVPALRDRPEDIPLLAHQFALRAAQRYGLALRGIARSTMDALCAHQWPGNVRELRNVIERALVLGGEDVLRVRDALAPASHGADTPLHSDGRPLAELMREFKARQIITALEACGGNQRRAAERLGLHPPSLSRMIRDLGIRSRAHAATGPPSHHSPEH